MTIDELIKRSHAMAVEKGWWPEGDHPGVVEQVNNFHAEISAAWEEYQAGRMETWYLWKDEAFIPFDAESVTNEDGMLVAKNKWMKPEGFWIEIADLLIRLADTTGAYGWYVSDVSIPPEREPPLIIKRLRKLANELDSEPRDEWKTLAWWDASRIFVFAIASAQLHGIDLLSLCELKMAYNATQPIRHGGKKA